MILRNLKTIDNQQLDIEIAKEKIYAIEKNINHAGASCNEIVFENAIVFPGLINSHDHLDFNLFPQLGSRTYANYTEWGRHIHDEYKKEIAAVLKVPLSLRLQWGVYKNLLGGVTTVVNHGKKIHIEHPLITIHQQTQNLHSVEFEKYWKLKLNNPILKNRSCTIHTGEGIDQLSFSEINKLIRWNFLKRKLVGIHGVSMQAKQAKFFEALVCCPMSNDFLFKARADINELSQHTKLLFGTDSTLTGNWNIWNHIRQAHQQQINTLKIFNSLTITPAAVWNLNTGELQKNKNADMVIAKCKMGNTSIENFLDVDPENILLVIHKGKIRLFDESIYNALLKSNLNMKRFSKIEINKQVKFIEGDITALIKKIIAFYPSAQFPISA